MYFLELFYENAKYNGTGKFSAKICNGLIIRFSGMTIVTEKETILHRWPGHEKVPFFDEGNPWVKIPGDFSYYKRACPQCQIWRECLPSGTIS
jgi:hypothetical protein